MPALAPADPRGAHVPIVTGADQNGLTVEYQRRRYGVTKTERRADETLGLGLRGRLPCGG
jgi:hypothetical protein